jgi:mono/diheme cytochrome c family protein
MSGNYNIPHALIKVLAGLTFVSLFSFLSVTVASAEEPKVPFTHAKGGKLYKDNCAVCHGETLTGTKQGPPLLHPFYKPSHHADFSFYRAALKGVQAHHWEFGDMPPIQGITREDMDAIVPFIRWYQKEKGLF